MGPPQGAALGDLVPLESSLTLGSSEGAGFRVASVLNAPEQCEVFAREGRWWLRDLNPSFGTSVSRRALQREGAVGLEHEACFSLPNGTSLRFLARAPVRGVAEAARGAVREAPDDASRWAVWSDALLEQGDPLGARLASPRAEDDLHWLGPFAAHATCGECEVRWAHGLPAHVVLRTHSTNPLGLDWADRVEALVHERTFSMVRTLEVDLGAFAQSRLVAAEVTQALECLGDAFPSLERLCLGPSPTPVDLRTAHDAWYRFRDAHPRLVTSIDELVPVWAPQETDQLLLFRGHWCARAPQLLLNGLAMDEAYVRPGDVLELPGQPPLRFSW